MSNTHLTEAALNRPLTEEEDRAATLRARREDQADEAAYAVLEEEGFPFS